MRGLAPCQSSGSAQTPESSAKKLKIHRNFFSSAKEAAGTRPTQKDDCATVLRERKASAGETMDIHRCRFVPYPPSTINTLAFSHSFLSNRKGGASVASVRLAIGRANGDIEIWNPLGGAWLQEVILRGGKDRSVDGLVWTQDPDEVDEDGKAIPNSGKLRLFSIGYTTAVTEWDLVQGVPLRQTSGNHGEIWCLAAQPALKPDQKNNAVSGQWLGQHLITGCTDGAVVLYSTADEELEMQKVLVRPSAKKAKVISITFQDRNIVVAGCTDSTIRIYDIRNGSLVRNMSLGAGPSGGPREIIIWAVKCLPNGNIVSGDSAGEMRIWDGKTYTQTQRIKSHNQDVLSIAASSDGSTLFSGGMDRRTIVYKQVGTGRPRWAEASHRRYHAHDVKALATLEIKGVSVVASGGPDANPIITPLREFGLENQRTLSSLPQGSALISAPRNRLIASWWDREVHIWRIGKKPKTERGSAESEGETEEHTKSRKLVAKILVKGEASITSVSISQDGAVLVVSTVVDVKAFRLQERKAHDIDTLRVSKVELPEILSTKGAKVVEISQDGKWLAIVQRNNHVRIARITSTARTIEILDSCSRLRRMQRNTDLSRGGLGAYDRTITHAAFSADSRMLAVADLAGYIDTWVLEGVEDKDSPAVVPRNDPSSQASDSEGSEDDNEKASVIFGQHWTRNRNATLMPRLPSSPLVLSFRPAVGATPAKTNVITLHATRHNPHPISHELPTGEDRLLVLTAGKVGSSSKVLEFHALTGALTTWSRENPIQHFPDEFRGLRDHAKGCVWDVRQSRERVWLYGNNWMWMFDLSQNLPTYPAHQAAESEADGGRMNELVNGNAELVIASGVDSAGARSQKRKRGAARAEPEHTALQKGTSGAGSKVPDRELGTGMSRKVQKYVMDEMNETKEISRARADLADNDDGDGDVDMEMNEDDEEDEDGLLQVDQSEPRDNVEDDGEAPALSKPYWWNTYKYRPILGIAPLAADEHAIGPEVVLVERPIWDVDLPPRYYGDQEWVKPGV